MAITGDVNGFSVLCYAVDLSLSLSLSLSFVFLVGLTRQYRSHTVFLLDARSIVVTHTTVLCHTITSTSSNEIKVTCP